jgi:hypothetical protein
MSQEGTWPARLKKAEAELQVELDLWTESKLDPQGYRMGNYELLIRCEILVIMEVLKDRLDVTDDELNARLKEVMLRELSQLRPQVVEDRRRQIQAALMQGVRPQI